MEISVDAYDSLGDFQKAIECHEKHLKIAIEIGDRAGLDWSSLWKFLYCLQVTG